MLWSILYTSTQASLQSTNNVDTYIVPRCSAMGVHHKIMYKALLNYKDNV